MQFFDGLAGALYAKIADWQPVSDQSVGGLLWSDTIAIVCYATLLPILAFGLLRLAGRDGAAPPIFGKVFCYSVGFLPASDLAENVLTYLALRQHAWGPLWSYMTFAASSAKFALLAAFVVTAMSCVLIWVMRGLGQAGPVVRPAI